MIASKFKIKLIFFGENEAEYGNPKQDMKKSIRSRKFFSAKNLRKIYLAGCSLKYLKEKYNLNLKDLKPFLPIKDSELSNYRMETHYLGYYLKWTPQEAYYYAVQHTNFKPRPFRTEGTYSKYNSIDDKIDDLHYYTTFIKYGYGRASHDASQEIRNKHLTRDEGIKLVKQFDGEFPKKYFQEIMEYIDMKPENFYKICDKFRSPHIWKKIKDTYKLRHTVNKDGTDDN